MNFGTVKKMEEETLEAPWWLKICALWDTGNIWVRKEEYREREKEEGRKAGEEDTQIVYRL